MTIIPLGINDVQSKDENASRIRLENMYLIDSPFSPDGISRVSRPTLTTFLSFGDGPVYGAFQEDGVLEGVWFVVSGNGLYSYDPLSKTTTLIDNVPGQGFCEFAGGSSSGQGRLLVLRDHVVYSWDGVTFTTINMPDDDMVGSVCYIDSYFILSVYNNPEKIGRFYWISPGLTDPDPLDFATAERAPDDLVSAAVMGDELWLIGQSSVEVWAPGTNSNLPFQRVSGRAYTYGCVNNTTTVQSNFNGYPCLLWVTDNRIVVQAQGSPSKVSNDSIDELLKTATNLRCWGFQYNRHNFYVVTADEVTVVYDLTKQTWSRWSSFSGPNFRGHVGFQFNQDVYAGDSQSGSLYQLVEGTDDDGDPVIRVVSGLVIFQGNYMNCTRINVVMNSGWTQDYADSAVLEVRWSDDLGYTYEPYYQIPIGETGQYKTDVSLSGLGMIRRPGRLFEFRFSDKARFRLDYATMNEM